MKKCIWGKKQVKILVFLLAGAAFLQAGHGSISLRAEEISEYSCDEYGQYDSDGSQESESEAGPERETEREKSGKNSLYEQWNDTEQELKNEYDSNNDERDEHTEEREEREINMEEAVEEFVCEEDTEEAREETVPEGEETEEICEENPKDTEIDNDEEEKENTADLLMEAIEYPEYAKAGNPIVYEIKIENTGDRILENLTLDSEFSEDELSGVWTVRGDPEDGRAACCFDVLKPGQEQICYLSVFLPETLKNPVSAVITVRAEYMGVEQEKKKELERKMSLITDVRPLKIDFEVTKTADRMIAAAGDRILYQICIRNTGERTLHSVLTTEKFQMENIAAKFLQKEGVQYNQTRTKALIPRIDPGQTVSLQAAVDLPETLQVQELINEVTVVAAETEGRAVVSRAAVQIYTDVHEEMVQEATGEANPAGTASSFSKKYPVSSNPRTADDAKTELWLFLLSVSLLPVTYFILNSGRQWDKAMKTKD